MNTEFCKEKSGGGQREALFKDLASGYDVFNDLQNNLMEGTKFYNDLTEVITQNIYFILLHNNGFCYFVVIQL